MADKRPRNDQLISEDGYGYKGDLRDRMKQGLGKNNHLDGNLYEVEFISDFGQGQVKLTDAVGQK